MEGNKDGNAQPSVCKYNQKRRQFRMRLTCQSCEHTELLPVAVPHAVKMDARLRTPKLEAGPIVGGPTLALISVSYISLEMLTMCL